MDTKANTEIAPDFTQEVIRRIGLQCDRTTFEGGTIRFHFDTESSWTTIFMKLIGVKDAVVQAYYIGFREFIFIRHDGREFPTDYRCWVSRDRGHLRGRSR